MKQLPGTVTLREVIDTDLPIFYEHQCDPESVAMAGVPGREADAFDAHWVKVRANPEGIVRTIVADGQVVGYALSFLMDGKREVGYFLGKEYWGQGIATRALAGFLTVVTQRPLYATVALHNGASRRVLEKCGFEFIGEITDHLGPVNEFVLR